MTNGISFQSRFFNGLLDFLDTDQTRCDRSIATSELSLWLWNYYCDLFIKDVFDNLEQKFVWNKLTIRFFEYGARKESARFDNESKSSDC